MRRTRNLAIPSALALLLTFAGGCGDSGQPGGDGVAADDVRPPSEVTVDDPTADPTDESDPADVVDPSETSLGDDGGAAGPVTDVATGTPIIVALADAQPPADLAGVTAVLEALPAELIGGTKQVSARTAGDLAADYVAVDRMSRYGIQAMDLRTSMMGAFVSEPVAEQMVAVLAEGGDWEVDDTGVEGSLHWVAWLSTGSGEGIEGIEEIYSLTWGEAGSPWAFVAGAPTEQGRDELVTAFIAAIAEVAGAPDPEPATPDEQAAQAALLTDEDLGPEWFSQPRLLPGPGAFHELAIGLMADEPLCAAALGWLDSEDVALSGLFDVFAAGAIVRAEGPTYLLGRDGMSDLQHTVLVFADAEQPVESLRSTRRLGWMECASAIYGDLVQTLYDRAFPGVTVNVDAAGERSLDVGDVSIALRFELTLRAPDDEGDLGLVQDISIVTVGRAASTIVQQSFAGGIDDAQMDELIERAAERLMEQFGDPSEGGS